MGVHGRDPMTTTLDRIAQIHDATDQLLQRLEEVRQTVPEEEFEAIMEGPLGDLLCAVLDLEYACQ